MEIRINREVREYTEAIFFGLSLRQSVFSLLAVAVAVGAYFLMRGRFGTETVSWACMLCAAPFAAMGFIKYNGMAAERFMLAWLRSELVMPRKLMFRGLNIYYEAVRPVLEGGRGA